MNSRWKDKLKRLLGKSSNSPLVIVGVGNTLKGDDGAGSLLAQRLSGKIQDPVFDGGSAPENYCERISVLKPRMVLVIDTAFFGGLPGEVRILKPVEIMGGGISTHGQSLGLLSDYLKLSCGCEVFIIGIQPLSVGLGLGLSAAVGKTVDELEGIFKGFCLTLPIRPVLPVGR